MQKTEKIMQCISLLSMIKDNEISVKEAIDLLEIITKSPEIIKESLKLAEKEGLIKRKNGKILLKVEETKKFQKSSIRRKKCISKCKKCGRKITNCFFIEFEDFSLGPFGSECIRKLGIKH